MRLGAGAAAGVEVLAGLKAGERVALDPVRAGLAGAVPAAGERGPMSRTATPAGAHSRRSALSGRLARAFQANALTPLLALVALLLGVFAVLVTPREEEPQINVTMANVLIAFPGASSADVQNMVARPAEQVLSADRRHRAHLLGRAPRHGRADGAVQGRRAAHRGAGAPVRRAQRQPGLAAAPTWAR